MSGGSKKNTQSQTQKTESSSLTTSEPWKAARPFFGDLYNRGWGAMQKVQNSPFQGDFIAAPNQWQQQATSMLANLSGTVGQGSGDLRDMALSTIRGDFLDPSTNPWLESAVQQSLAPVNERYSNVLIPQVTDQAVAQGAYGGSRLGLQQEDLLKNYAREAGGLSSQIYAGNYQQERDRQMGAGQLLSIADALSMMPASVMGMAGQGQNQLDQAVINNELAKFQEGTAAPWRGIGEMAQLLTAGGFGTNQGTGTQTSSGTITGTQGGQGGFGGAIQGALGGAGTGMGMASGLGVGTGLAGTAALGAFAPWMAPFALLGGLGGYFG